MLKIIGFYSLIFTSKSINLVLLVFIWDFEYSFHVNFRENLLSDGSTTYARFCSWLALISMFFEMLASDCVKIPSTNEINFIKISVSKATSTPGLYDIIFPLGNFTSILYAKVSSSKIMETPFPSLLHLI